MASTLLSITFPSAPRPSFFNTLFGLELATLKEGARVMASLDWSQCSAVESIPGKVSGAWVFKGTRMPVQTVFDNLEAGMSVDEITEVFDVTPEEVKAVLHFASESLAKAPAPR
jgi:uncharacterized protein (DUF433 family)